MLTTIIGRLIGGATGKRQTAWAVFALWCAAFVWLMVQEAHGVSMPATQAILSLMGPAALTLLGVAYGLEWNSTQSKWAPGNTPARQPMPGGDGV